MFNQYLHFLLYSQQVSLIGLSLTGLISNVLINDKNYQ
jgi:hypothetical protein